MTPKVLIADDLPHNLTAIERCLDGLEIDIHRATTGNDVLEFVAENDPAFILMDLGLPDVDGIEVTKLIHGDRTKLHIPVVLLTAKERTGEIMYRAFEAGVLDFLTAPYQCGLVRAKARLYLDLYASRRRVELQNRALAESNHAFRDFAHAAAHDLRAPIRAIRNFTEWMLEDGDDIVERRDLGGKILESATRMEAMLSGMLEYAQADGATFERESVDLEEIIDDVRLDLDAELRRTEARLDVGELPVLTGSPIQLTRLFQNIVGNAMKYGRRGVPPVIEVRAEIRGGLAALTVSDNGTGFDMKHVEELFRPFRRLVGASEAEGSGIGMATARK
ncbi:MAG: response regulator, partial [Planctomycetes bacterium]|nr:response regulator [Planctomycetota bacterium]